MGGWMSIGDWIEETVVKFEKGLVFIVERCEVLCFEKFMKLLCRMAVAVPYLPNYVVISEAFGLFVITIPFKLVLRVIGV